MRAWTASDILNIWEEGKPSRWVDRGLLLLAAWDGTKSIETLSALTIGERDACLLEMRDKLFGPHLLCIAACPRCSQQLEFDLKGPDLKIKKPDAAGDVFTINEGDYQVSFRLPNSRDLSDLPQDSDETLMRQQIIQRCFNQALRSGREIPPDALPEKILSAVVGCMSEMDPQADLRLGLECPQCKNRWDEVFDILPFLWSEIQSCALRLLREVHVLASAYGWSEAEILALSSIRRQAYLELIGT
jgi:hypothetical protein